MREFRRRALVSDALLDALKLGVPLALLPLAASAAPPEAKLNVDRVETPESTMSVKKYGAVGDGEADDTEAFRRALATKDDVFVPAGTYRLTGPLVVNGATLFGEGPRSILKCATPDFDLLTISGSGVRIHGLSIWGAATDTTTHQTGIVTSISSPPDDFAVSDVRFSGPHAQLGLNNGIKFDDKARNCRVQGNHFERLFGAKESGYGIFTGIVDGLVVISNTFEGSRAAQQGRHAVYVSGGGRRVTASHNIVREFNCEALCTNAYFNHPPVEQLIFAHNLIHRCGGEGSNQSSISVGGKASTVRIEGNIIVESFGCGILCDSGRVEQENICVEGNIVIDSAYMGIRQLGALHQTIRNNYVRGSSRAKVGNWADIVVGAGIFPPNQIVVAGNQCVPVPGISFCPFVLDASKPLPISVRINGNDFPRHGYMRPADYAVGTLQPIIDGRLQFRIPWQPSLLGETVTATASFLVTGAEVGDIVVCSHPVITTGMILTSTVTSTHTVTVRLINAIGRVGNLPAGLLSIDVWKSSST